MSLFFMCPPVLSPFFPKRFVLVLSLLKMLFMGILFYDLDFIRVCFAVVTISTICLCVDFLLI